MKIPFAEAASHIEKTGRSDSENIFYRLRPMTSDTAALPAANRQHYPGIPLAQVPLNAEPAPAQVATIALSANRYRPDWYELRTQGTEHVAPQERNTDQDTRLLVGALQSAFPARPPRKFDSWEVPSLNVLDCVLSLNRPYDTFCFPRVQEFANRHPTVGTLTGLLELITAYASPLEFSVRVLDYRDEGRAATLVGVVKWLLAVQQRFSGASETSRLT